jgi:hypothetical protein
MVDDTQTVKMTPLSEAGVIVWRCSNLGNDCHVMPHPRPVPLCSPAVRLLASVVESLLVVLWLPAKVRKCFGLYKADKVNDIGQDHPSSTTTSSASVEFSYTS